MELHVICSMQDLWVIYEILQAKKVILESVDSHSGAVGADITAVVPVGGPPVGANLRMSATKKTLFEVTAPDNKAKAFGVRAIHARYDSTGEFFSFRHVEEGSTLLTVWGEQESKNIDHRLDLGGLFLKHLLICTMMMEMTFLTQCSINLPVMENFLFIQSCNNRMPLMYVSFMF